MPRRRKLTLRAVSRAGRPEFLGASTRLPRLVPWSVALVESWTVPRASPTSQSHTGTAPRRRLSASMRIPAKVSSVPIERDQSKRSVDSAFRMRSRHFLRHVVPREGGSGHHHHPVAPHRGRWQGCRSGSCLCEIRPGCA